MAVGLVLAVVGVGWAIGWVVFARAPTLRTTAIAEPHVPVDVVVVARDEATRLPRLLAALARQTYLAQRVIVVDAASQDGTADLAHAARATVVAPGPVPTGDTPTGWARRQGAMAGNGSVLVFLDPGTEPDPDFLRRAVTEHLRLGGLLSVLPYRRVHGIRDRLGAFVDVVTAMAVGGMGVGRSGGRVTGAFAACMVCDREDFLAVSGNAELRTIPGYPAVARRFAGAGRPVHARLGRGALDAHGAGGPDGLGERARDLRAGLGSTPGWRAAAIAWWCVALALAAIVLVTGVAGWVLGPVLYALCAVQVLVLLRRVADRGVPTALLYPVPLLAVAGAYVWAWARRGVSRSR